MLCFLQILNSTRSTTRILKVEQNPCQETKIVPSVTHSFPWRPLHLSMTRSTSWHRNNVIKLTSNTEPSNTISKKGKTHNLNLEQKVNNKIEFQNKKKIHNSPSTSEQDVSIMTMNFLQLSTSSLHLHLIHDLLPEIKAFRWCCSPSETESYKEETSSLLPTSWEWFV